MSNRQFPRVAHFSTSLNGGAGIACFNLHLQLLEYGIQSNILTLDGNVDKENVHNIARNLTNKVLGPIFSTLNRKISEESYFSIFSNNTLTKEIVTRLGNPEELVLHIHNWFNLSNFNFFDELAFEGYRFVFTMHDERIFTGACHYSLDCRGFKTGCSSCPKVPSVFKSVIASNANSQSTFFSKYRKQIKIVAPSIWIREEALGGSVLKDQDVRNIRNFIDLGHIEKSTRSQVEFPIRLGVASMEPFSYIKGGGVVRKIQSTLQNDERFQLVFLRELILRNKTAASFWNSIDYLLVPSIQDNSPNVIHEAKVYELPVIGSDVGGIPELLDDRIDILIENQEPINTLLDRIFAHFEAREGFEGRDTLFFDKREVVIGQLIALYADLVGAPNA